MNKTNYESLLLLIPEGEKNAISQKDLSTLLGCTERETRALIQTAREDKIPILSIPGYTGYFVSRNPYEVTRCIRAFTQRRKANEETLKTLYHYIDYLEDDLQKERETINEEE